MRLALAFVLLAVAAAGCAVYDAPPEPSIAGLTQGVLSDDTAPIVVAFDKPAVASTINLTIAPYLAETPGNLGDESTGMPIFTHDPVMGDTGGVATLAPGGKSVSIQLSVAPPAGKQFAVLVAPGLADAAGTVTKVERVLVFGYASNLTCNAPVKVLRSGAYFLVTAITKPVGTHVNLWGVIDVDPATGQFTSRFTKAQRNPNLAGCPMPCPSGEICALLPTPGCVPPSEPAASVDDYSDYVFDADPPAGFGFGGGGCTADQGATSASFETRKVDIVLQMPPVTLRNAQLSASFTVDAEGVLRGTGSLSADAVLLGTINSGVGAGEVTARSIPPADVPKGLPGP